MADIDREALPSVAEGRELIARHRQAAAQEEPEPASLTGMGAFTAGMANLMEEEAAAAQRARDELAEITPSTPAGSSAFNAFVAASEGAMQADTDDLDMHDGLTWWERVAVVLHDAGERVTAWVRDHWQSAVARFAKDREGNEPQPEPDHRPGSGPDMGR